MTLKSSKIFALTAAALLAAPAIAQEVDMALDTNGDGMFSFPELAAGYPDLTDEQFTVMDVTGDGLLDSLEVGEAVAAGMITPSGG